jgi:hypothetical protein
MDDPTSAEIQAAAKAMYEFQFIDQGITHFTSWNCLGFLKQAWYRGAAEAALKAAAEVRHG